MLLVLTETDVITYQLLFLLYSPQTYKDEKYLKAAKDCAEVIWQRGLLKKGYGICHGPAGNAYAFLAMYKLTNDMAYLYRAYKVGKQKTLADSNWYN